MQLFRQWGVTIADTECCCWGLGQQWNQHTALFSQHSHPMRECLEPGSSWGWRGAGGWAPERFSFTVMDVWTYTILQICAYIHSSIPSLVMPQVLPLTFYRSPLWLSDRTERCWLCAGVVRGPLLYLLCCRSLLAAEGSVNWAVNPKTRRGSTLIIVSQYLNPRKKLTHLLLAFEQYCSLHSSIALFPLLQKWEDEIERLCKGLWYLLIKTTL